MSICEKCKKKNFCVTYAYLLSRGIGFPNECGDFIGEQTNEEWFCNLSTEEKAEFYAKLTLGCYKCGEKGSLNIKNCGFDYCLCSKRDFVKWLKQPHTTRGDTDE